jgi:hypothetical protein
MNINTLLGSSTSTLTSSSTGTSTAQTGSTSAVSTVPPALVKAGQRLQSDADATTAQLSKFGLLKSALADGQASAKALSALGSAASASDVTKALAHFFNTFNGVVTAANTAATSGGSVLASSNAKRVVQDLKTALRSDPASEAALKQLGLSVQSDGTLVQDAKKFASALSGNPAGVRSALATLGKKVDAVASRELASNGTVDTALASLNQHSTTLTSQQKAMKAMQQALSAYQTASS